MRFTIDCYKTHQTEASTLDLYGEHFAEGDSKVQDSTSKMHHIADGSESDEYFLEDDEDEVFSSLMPASTKPNDLTNSRSKLKTLERLENAANFQNLIITKIFKSITPNGQGVQKFIIKPDHQLTKQIDILQSDKAKSLSELEEYVFNIIHSRKNKYEKSKDPKQLQ